MPAGGIVSVKVQGAEQVASSMARAGRELSNLGEPDARATEMIAASIRGFAPHVTGQLAGSIGPSGHSVVATAPYAGPQNYGWAARGIVAREFMIEGARAVESQWVGVYTKHVQDKLDQIKGI